MEVIINNDDKKNLGGRPLLPEREKRKNRITLRFTDEELKQFEDVPKRKLNQFLVNLILNRKRNIKSINPLFFDLLKELTRIGTNLNQITHRINKLHLITGERVDPTEDVLKILSLVKEELKKCLQN